MEHAEEGNGEGHTAREPARGITHACSLRLSAIAIHACSETRELSIRAPSAFAIERAASFRAASPPAAGQNLQFLSRRLFPKSLYPCRINSNIY